MQLLQFKTHLYAQLGIEVREWLIKQEPRRIAHNRASHRHTLALTAGKLARATFEQTVQLQNARRFFNALGYLLLAHAANFQPPRHVFFDAHMRIKRVILEHHRNPAIFRLHFGHALVVDPDIAFGHPLQPGNHTQQRRFPAARRPDHHDKFAIRHIKGQRFNDLGFAIPAFGYCL